MKVIDLELFRRKKEIESLERKIGELAHAPSTGAAHEMKICFKEWLLKTGSLQ